MAEGNPTTYVTVTAQVRTVMQRAAEEARRLNYEYVGPAEIFLALLTEASGGAAIALTNLRVDQHIVRLEIMKIVQPGPGTVSKGMLPQTPRAKRAIEYAIEEAQSLQQSTVGTGHLLLGLLRDPDGVPALIFANLGVKIEDVRYQVARYSDGEMSATQIAEGLPPNNAGSSEDALPDEWAHLRNSEPSAMQVFFAWEKLRIVYNVVLATLVLVAIGPEIGTILEGTVLGAIGANVAFCAGPFVENYLCWMGGSRSVVRWVVFLFGMLVALGVTVVAIHEAPVPKWLWF